jgi:hypothetical protein
VLSELYFNFDYFSTSVVPWDFYPLVLLFDISVYNYIVDYYSNPLCTFLITRKLHTSMYYLLRVLFPYIVWSLFIHYRLSINLPYILRLSSGMYNGIFIHCLTACNYYFILRITLSVFYLVLYNGITFHYILNTPLSFY